MSIVPPQAARPEKSFAGFTLTELLVILAMLAMLACVQVVAFSGGKDQIRIAQCAGNIRQIALATQIYANENQDNLPTGVRAWAWDLPDGPAQAMLAAGCRKTTFYCPGTQPLYTDSDNFLAPSPSSLWTFAEPTFHVIGYALAFPGSNLFPTNQNNTILAERVNSVLVSPAARVLIADVILSTGNVLPASPADNFTNIPGGFKKPHTSTHVFGQMPMGSNLAFKDGHVSWNKFNAASADANNNDTKVRSSGPYFWW